MRYDSENEGYNRRGQYGSNRRSQGRYHQFGAEEDRSIRDSSRNYGRSGSSGRDYENPRLDDDFYREQDRSYEAESRSSLGSDSNFGGRSFSRDRGFGYERDSFPTQNRFDSNRGFDYSMDRPYRSYGGDRYLGDFSGSRYGSYESPSRYEPEHRSMWESVKDFFGVGPKGYTRSDDRIREDVSDVLTRDRSVDASDIEVNVKSGIVTLRGSVSDKWMKRRAEDCAEEIAGVQDVRNELDVMREGISNMNQLSRGNKTGSIGTGGALSTGGTGVGTSAGTMSSGKNTDRSSSGKRKLS